MNEKETVGAQHSAVEFAELLWRAAYRMDKGYSPDVHYEAAAEQLLCEMAVMGDITIDEANRAQETAQEAIFGQARGEESRPLSEFGVTLADE